MQNIATVLVIALTISPVATAVAQVAEKKLVLTITAEQLNGGVVSEITWDGGTLVLQGAFAKPTGELSAKYFVQTAREVALEERQGHTAASAEYWDRKSRQLSPTGIGRITVGKDEKLPMYGIASQEQRMIDANDMGGTHVLHTTKLGNLLLNERVSRIPPYDGELWGWSTAEINKIAYIDKKGDLWIALADGRDAQRVLSGDFMLPAWSDDGTQIAVAERKNNGKKWEISIVTLPPSLRAP